MKAPNFKTLDYGAICGIARIVGTVTKSRSKWFNQPSRGLLNYGWVLADVKRLRKPINCKGALQLWNVPPNIQNPAQPDLFAKSAPNIGLLLDSFLFVDWTTA
jgi:hypothetical protein